MMNFSNDPVDFLSCTILGLKNSLLEAEKENQTLQKLLLSFYVKDAAKETNLYKMNRTGAKMNEIFQKEKQDLNSKILELEARLSDTERENVNLNFQIKELKAFLEEKTNLLEVYNHKNADLDKLVLNSLKEKDLIQIIKNVLVCMKDSRVSRELRTTLKKIEQKKLKNFRKIKGNGSDVEISNDEMDLMSAVIENQLRDDEFSIKCEKNDLSSVQSIYENTESYINDSNESPVADAETNSSHNNATDCIRIDQQLLSPLSIADSDYSSNGVKSVESLNSERTQSTSVEPSGETNILLIESDPCLQSHSVETKLPNRSEIPKDVVSFDDSVGDDQEMIKWDEMPFVTPEDLNSVVDSVLSEMINICYPTTVVETFRDFCREDDISGHTASRDSCQDFPVPTLMADESQTLEIIPTHFDVQTSLSASHEKRNFDLSLEKNDFKKTKMAENLSDSLSETRKMHFISAKSMSADEIPPCENETKKKRNLFESQIENSENVSGVSVLKSKNASNDFRLSPLKGDSVSKNVNIVSIQLNSTSPNPDVLIGVDTTSLQNTELSSSGRQCIEIASVERSANSEDGFLISRFNDRCTTVTSSSTLPVLPKPAVSSIFDVEIKTGGTEWKNTSNVSPQSDLISSNYDILLKDVNSSSSNFESVSNNNESVDKVPGNNLTESESRSLQSCLDESATSGVPGSQKHHVSSIFDLESDYSEFKNISSSDSVDIMNEKISLLDDFDNSAELAKKKSNNDAGLLEDVSNPVTNTYSSQKLVNSFEKESSFGCIYEGKPSKLEKSSDVISENFSNLPDSISLEDISNMIDENKNNSTGNAGTIDVSCILNEFAALGKQMQERISIFQEFLLQEELLEQSDKLSKNEDCNYPDTSSGMEYIVVAEILDDNVHASPDYDNEDNFVKDSAFCDNIIRSLPETGLKTVKFESLIVNSNCYKGSHSSNQDLFVSSFNSVLEVTDSSDDEKNELVIAEDDCDDILNDDVEISVDSSTNKGDIICNDKNDSTLIPNDVDQNLVVKSNDMNPELKKDQPIKEITNVPRYNFRRLAVNSEFSSDSSRSTHLSDATNSVLSPKCNSDLNSKNSTVEKSPENVQMKFYVENQMANNSSSLHVSVFDDVWNKMKISYAGSSNQLMEDANDLISCQSSVVNLVFNHRITKKPSNSGMPRESISKLPEVKKSLDIFLKEKIRNLAPAFSNFSSAVCRSNKTTLCRAMIEILLDCMNTNNNVRIQENFLREFTILSSKIDRNIFQGYMEALQNCLKNTMWTKNWDKNRSSMVVSLRLLGKFYTKLCKLNNDSRSVISFLHESLLSFKFRGHPIARSVLEEWPEIFPQDPDQRNSITHIILFTLVHHTMNYNRNLYCIDEVQQLISNLYHVKLGMKTAEEYAKELILQFNDETWNDAIALLCKRQMFPWSYTNVIMKYLIPILKKWKTENFPEGILSKTLNALRTLLRTCPNNEDENKFYSLDVIVNTLKEILFGDRGSRELKETVILILCDLSSMRFSLCAEVLCNWRPNDGVISTGTLQQLQTRMINGYKNNWWSFRNSSRDFGSMSNSRRISDRHQNERYLRPRGADSVIAVGVPKKLKKSYSNPDDIRKKKKKTTKKKKKRKCH